LDDKRIYWTSGIDLRTGWADVRLRDFSFPPYEGVRYLINL
jgi:hypothetical protein